MKLWTTFLHTLNHLWMDADDTRRAIPPEMLERLQRRVAASEQRHSGEIRICVEAGLPLSYLWRGAPARERAVTMFGKLRVWDTEHNNGVLIYLLLADHAIEIVADRGLARHVNAAQWQAMVVRMAEAFKEKRYEDGLTQALEETSALLMTHFAVGDAANQTNPNELPDSPVLQ
ncbi:TPM domain-containing protein [Polaromonas sp.]|uniref:TPM domain-containing protein n=1 Tax=Polaromonas sp. TaxID=1869339 RepID=UPI0037533684